jgi:hypothetical protein
MVLIFCYSDFVEYRHEIRKVHAVKVFCGNQFGNLRLFAVYEEVFYILSYDFWLMFHTFKEELIVGTKIFWQNWKYVQSVRRWKQENSNEHSG